MFYHASKTANLKILEPRVSNHGVPLVYLSKKRENVLVYLSNAVEKYCRETGFEYRGIWEKWGSYGFDENGVLRVEEYYPNALEKTYKGEAGYIYTVENVVDSGEEIQIPDAVTSDMELEVSGCEFVPDAYEAILEAERRGLIHIERYEELTSKKREWIEKTIKAEYEEAKDHPEYRHFLRGNLQDILEKLAMVSYREIREADNALLADIIRKNLEKYKLDIPGTVYFDDNLNHLSNYYLAKKDKRFYLISVEDEELVGGIGLAECDLFPECAELQKLYLTDKVKGRRLGYELVRRIEEKARELGYKRMYLETHTNLDIAIHLYEKCGYKEISRPSEVVHSTMNKFYLKEF